MPTRRPRTPAPPHRPGRPGRAGAWISSRRAPGGRRRRRWAACPRPSPLSSGTGCSQTGTTRAPSRPSTAIPPASTPPPTAMHATPADLASCATPERGLAECGLGVDPAFAGDDEVCAGELVAQAGLVHDDLDAGHEAELTGTGRRWTAGRRRSRRPRRRRAWCARRGPSPAPADPRRRPARCRGPRRPPATRPSGARRSRRRRSARGAGS